MSDRRQSTSKVKEEVQLPKINKHYNQQPSNYIQRYEWLTRKSEYLLLSQPVIQQEQQYLTNELNSLNHEYADLLNHINHQYKVKPLKKSRIKDKNQEHREREIENNYMVMSRLKNQCEILQKRMSSVNGGQSQIDKCMIEAKEKIFKLKQKIKELKLRSKEMGQNIQNGPDIFIDLKKLQNQRNAGQNRKYKLQEKIQSTQASIVKLNEQLQDISGNFMYAESYLQQQAINDKVNAEERTMQQLYRQRLYQLQIIRKTIQSFRSTRQQKYLQSLKGLETLVEVNKSLGIKVQRLQIKSLNDKKEVIELEELLSQAIQLKSRSKTSQEESKDDTSIYRGGFDKGKTSRQDISNKRGKFYNIPPKQNEVRYRKNTTTLVRQQQKQASYAQRLRSSETKPQIYPNHTVKLILQKKPENNISALSNDVEIFPTQIYEQQKAELLKMIIQPGNYNRGGYMRNSKTKIKQTNVQDLKINNYSEKDQQSMRTYIQRITEQSPNKEDQIQQVQEPKQTIPVLQQNIQDQVNELKGQQSNIQQSILKQNEDIDNRKQPSQQLIQADKKTIVVKSSEDIQNSRLKHQRDMISNYVDQLEEDDQQI